MRRAFSQSLYVDSVNMWKAKSNYQQRLIDEAISELLHTMYNVDDCGLNTDLTNVIRTLDWEEEWITPDGPTDKFHNRTRKA